MQRARKTEEISGDSDTHFQKYGLWRTARATERSKWKSINLTAKDDGKGLILDKVQTDFSQVDIWRTGSGRKPTRAASSARSPFAS
jgi:hypothetical protein